MERIKEIIARTILGEKLVNLRTGPIGLRPQELFRVFGRPFKLIRDKKGKRFVLDGEIVVKYVKEEGKDLPFITLIAVRGESSMEALSEFAKEMTIFGTEYRRRRSTTASQPAQKSEPANEAIATVETPSDNDTPATEPAPAQADKVRADGTVVRTIFRGELPFVAPQTESAVTKPIAKPKAEVEVQNDSPTPTPKRSKGRRPPKGRLSQDPEERSPEKPSKKGRKNTVKFIHVGNEPEDDESAEFLQAMEDLGLPMNSRPETLSLTPPPRPVHQNDHDEDEYSPNDFLRHGQPRNRHGIAIIRDRSPEFAN